MVSICNSHSHEIQIIDFKLGHKQMLQHLNVRLFLQHSSVDFLLPNSIMSKLCTDYMQKSL